MSTLPLSAALIAISSLISANAADPVAKKPPEQKPVLSELPQASTPQPSTMQATPIPPWALPVSPASISMISRPIEGSLSLGATAGNTQIDSRLSVDPVKGQMSGIAVNIRIGPNN
jgi:hypothetical protein